MHDRQPDARPEPIPGLHARYRSEHELVVFKPAGVASQLSDDTKGASLLERVKAGGFPDAKLPHRLDRPTSGLLLIALHADAIARHNEHIRAHDWRKLYIARCSETFAPPEQLLGDHTLFLARRDMTARIVRSGGDEARTTVHAVATDPVNRRARQALVEIHTGRFHQIRATLAHLGAPLIGDTRYAGPGPERAFFLEHAALRFTPFDTDTPRWVFSRDPRDRRSPVAPEIDAAIRAITAGDRPPDPATPTGLTGG
jgi:23S rRNA pseudouridine1911/1915/1917 synthase